MGRILFGILVQSEAEQLQRQSRSGLKATFTIENEQQIKDAERNIQQFNKFSVQLFRNVVFEIHKYLIKISPAHTGRFRGGWTAFLDKYQQDYTPHIYDTSLYDAIKKGNITSKHRGYELDSGAMGAGKAFSVIEDRTPTELYVEIANKAPYGSYLEYEKGIHMTTRARYIGEVWLEKHFDEWLTKISAAGGIVEPPEVEEIGA